MGVNQETLYAELDVDRELSWSERDLPERERTKHVHRLHPYLGKFVPQLVEALLARYVPRTARVIDPFAGSGTTLVQCLESGRPAVGVDIAAFNCLLMRVKTARYNLFTLEHELRHAIARLEEFAEGSETGPPDSDYVRRWFAPTAAAELLFWRSILGEYEHADLMKVVLARAARSARLTTHFDLDFPREPQREPYWCYKHRRQCRPVDRANHFLRRYALDTLARVKAFAQVRVSDVGAEVLHGDSREGFLDSTFDAIVTSPPYPGLIDYHGQHRYAYELLGLEDRGSAELGRSAEGTGKQAIAAYVEGMISAFTNVGAALTHGAPVVIVVNDRRDLYSRICSEAGLRVEHRLRRHVNRRTGWRAGEFFEDVIVARRARRRAARSSSPKS